MGKMSVWSALRAKLEKIGADCHLCALVVKQGLDILLCDPRMKVEMKLNECKAVADARISLKFLKNLSERDCGCLRSPALSGGQIHGAHLSKKENRPENLPPGAGLQNKGAAKIPRVCGGVW